MALKLADDPGKEIWGTLKGFDDEVYRVSHGDKREQFADYTGTGTNLKRASVWLAGPEQIFPRNKVSSIRRLTPGELNQV